LVVPAPLLVRCEVIICTTFGELNDDYDADVDDARVKELGPGEIKPSTSSDCSASAAAAAAADAAVNGLTLHLLSAQKSDLTLLRNANVRIYTSHLVYSK